MTTPRVTWVVPVYNGESYLRAALASIASQSFSDFEAIVLNDGSTDSSGAIAQAFADRDPRFRVVEKPNSGLVDTLNKGVALARAQLIARMDADDICFPTRLQKQVTFLSENPNCVAVGALCTIIDETGCETRRMIRPMFVPAGPGVPPFPPPRYRLCHPTVVFHRAAFLAAGGYSDNFRAAEDYELWLRMSEFGDIAELREPLLRYRVHSASVTANESASQRLACLRADLVTTLRRAGTPPGYIAPLYSDLSFEEIMAVLRTITNAPPAEIVRLRFEADRLRAMLYRDSQRNCRVLAFKILGLIFRTIAIHGLRSAHRAAAYSASKEVMRWIAVSIFRRRI